MIQPGFDSMTRDSYFMILVEVFTNHILAENTYIHESYRVKRTQDYGLQACKYQTRHCHNFKNILTDEFHHHNKSKR